ncbi:MAG: hypothetical protein AAB654_17125, partial [Acidobacteriota bacterium]
MRNLRLMKDHWTPALLSLLLLAAFIFILAGRSLPFYPALRDFLMYDLPVHRMYFVMSENSEICPKVEAFEGLGEFFQTVRSLGWVSDRCRLVRHDDSGLQLWSTPFGDMWFPGSIEPQGVHFAIAQYKVEAYPGLRIRKGDVVLDCGGFVGDWTRFALSAGASRVVAVEPSSENLECLRRNLSR